MCDTNSERPFSDYSRGVTPSSKGGNTSQTPGAQLHIPINIPIKFKDCACIAFGDMHDTNSERPFFAIQGDITPPTKGDDTNQTPGAQLHIPISTHVKFQDYTSTAFGDTRDTKFSGRTEGRTDGQG